ncbi:MAG: hypothetical protein ABSG86_30375 [Thermoguttaceae bacterium]|jgi:hypothetical protein
MIIRSHVPRIHIALLFGLCWLAPAPAAVAHSISAVEGEALVHRDKVELTIKVRPEDILLSAGMTLIIADRIEEAVIVKGAEAHKKFLLDGLILSDSDGRRLAGKVTKVELFAVPNAGIPLEDLMSKTAVYRLEYPLARPPARLGFRQHFNTGAVAMPVIMQMSVLRDGATTATLIPVPEGEQAEHVAFDWSQTLGPGTSAAGERAAAAKPAALDAAEAFVYIQNDEVRVEILMPLPTLETWQAVPRNDKAVLEVAEQTAARTRLEALFTMHNELKIDGVAVRPKLGRFDFFSIDFKDLAARPEARRLAAATARVGTILTYSTKGAPRHVELKWTLFSDKAPAVRAVVFAYDKGSRFSFTSEQPTFAWDSPGAAPLPKIDSVPAGQSAADDAARAALAETLLRNIYRGFDYRSESDIYDALAQSVAGDLLTDLYLKIKQGLVVQEQGGAVARVQEVKVVRSEPAAGKVEGGFVERVTWQVAGTIEHWGHIHTRVNEYTADLGITSQGGAWRIVSMRVVRQSQVRNAISLRKL